MSFAVLQWAGTHHLAEHPAEMGGAGKAGLLGYRTDGKLRSIFMGMSWTIVRR